jgi:hypothetical protein
MVTMKQMAPKRTGKPAAAASGDWRVRYAPQIAAYKKKFGEEPTYGTIVAREARKACSKHTEEEREALIAYGQSLFYQARTEACAKRSKKLRHALPAYCR